MALKRFVKTSGSGVATMAFRGQYATLSSGLIGLMGKPERVDLYFDEASGEVGIEQGDDYRVSYKQGWTGGTLIAGAFIRECKLSGKKYQKNSESGAVLVFKEQNGLSK